MRAQGVFEIGRRYKRRADLHAVYGGQWQGGISTPSDHPIVFLFTGETGQQYGYCDAWDDAGVTFRYTGEGQRGDMQFTKGNAAIRDHALNGEDLHLFRIVGDGKVEYEGQMVCAGYDLLENVPDVDDEPRTAIVFRLVRLDAVVDELTAIPSMPTQSASTVESNLWSRPLTELRAEALQEPTKEKSVQQAQQNVYHRSEAIRIYVLRRADGMCEACRQDAPFTTAAGHPYLEPHHIRKLSDGGPDHPHWVIALCPNCHRRAHYTADSVEFNSSLGVKVQFTEQVKQP